MKYKVMLLDKHNNNFTKIIDYEFDGDASQFDYLWGDGCMGWDDNRAGLLYDEYDEKEYDETREVHDYILAKAWDDTGNVIFDEITPNEK